MRMYVCVFAYVCACVSECKPFVSVNVGACVRAFLSVRECVRVCVLAFMRLCVCFRVCVRA